jgi:hypothetical protein
VSLPPEQPDDETGKVWMNVSQPLQGSRVRVLWANGWYMGWVIDVNWELDPKRSNRTRIRFRVRYDDKQEVWYTAGEHPFQVLKDRPADSGAASGSGGGAPDAD